MARIAIPHLVRCTNWFRANMRKIDTTTIMIFLLVMNTPPIWYVVVSISVGKARRWEPRNAKLDVSRMMPIINPVIAAEARGAFLNGR